MKTNYFLFFMLLFGLFTMAQDNELGLCGVDDLDLLEPNIQSNGTFIINSTYSYKYVNIYFWGINDDEGNSSSPLTHEKVMEAMEHLNETYNKHNICFVLQGVGYINKSSIQNCSSLGGIYSYASSNGHYKSDAMNVYVPITLFNHRDSEGNEVCTTAGFAYRGANYTAVVDYALSNTYRTLEHEIGHCFGLYHTHGPFNTGYGGSNTNNPNCERVTRDPNDPDYNALTKGDNIHDTAADPQLNWENVDSETCQYIGAQVDCGGTPYVLTSDDVKNIMSYSPYLCTKIFTLGQEQFMHSYFESKPMLTQTLNHNMVNQSLDLMIRNTEQDYGVVPDTLSQYLWVSPDIWVRNTDDGELEHQNPISNSLNYVYVRVTNRSCEPSTGNETLRLSWSKAGISLPIEVWEGSVFMNGQPMGGLVGELSIPPIDGYQTVVLKYQWNTPNLINYEFVNEPWHYCLLGKINSPTEVESLPIVNGNDYLYRNSNNIALKNVTLIENTQGLHSGSILVGNFKPVARNIKIKIVKDYLEEGNSIFDEAEVSLMFDSNLLNLWKSRGSQGNAITVRKDEIHVVDGSEIIIPSFPANTFGTANVRVNFLTQNSSPKNKFKFHVIQVDEVGGVVGGEQYIVEKNSRNLFRAEIDQSDNVLQAENINESATYNWYNQEGELVHTGSYYVVTNENNETFKLEVVATDGYKDYAEVSYAEGGVQIESMSPNPVNADVTVTFTQNTTENMYLMIVDLNGNVASNYILPTGILETTFSLSYLQYGYYKLVLVKNNEPIHFKNFIKN